MTASPGVCSLLLAAALVASVPAQSPTAVPGVSVTSPEPDAYVSGATPITVSVDQPDAVLSVVFFVDGREQCTSTLPPFTCEWDAGKDVTEHLIRVVANLAGGGRVVKTVATKGLEGYAEHVDVDVVHVTVSVIDGQGRFIRNMPSQSFRVFEDGRPQPISHFQSENVPLDLVVALDISASMTPAVPKLKEAAKAFLGSVPSGDHVTLVGFNETMFTLTRRATSPAERVKAVDRLAAWGATSLYDVIIRSVDLLGSQTGRKALVIFTDGEDQGSYASIDDVERRLQASDVTLYVIAQGSGLTSAPLQRIMKRLVEPTGGRAVFTEKIDELHGVFSNLLQELSNQYLLGYARPDMLRDGRWRRITVEVDGYQNVRARQGYRVTRR